MFADMPARIAAVLTGSDVGVEHPRDHDPEGCAACFVLDGPPNPQGTADRATELARSIWNSGGAHGPTPSTDNEWLLSQGVFALRQELAAERAQRVVLQQERDQYVDLLNEERLDNQERVTELERERAGLLARAEQAEAELRHARDYCARPAGVCFDAALAGPGDPEEPTCYCGDLTWTVRRYGRVTHKQRCPARTDSWSQGDPHADKAEPPPCPHCGPTTRWDGSHGSFRCVGGCYWPQGEEAQ